MDENEAELLRLIYTRIGIILEDASVTALDLGGPESRFDEEADDRLTATVSSTSNLMDAATTIRE